MNAVHPTELAVQVSAVGADISLLIERFNNPFAAIASKLNMGMWMPGIGAGYLTASYLGSGALSVMAGVGVGIATMAIIKQVYFVQRPKTQLEALTGLFNEFSPSQLDALVELMSPIAASECGKDSDATKAFRAFHNGEITEAALLARVCLHNPSCWTQVVMKAHGGHAVVTLKALGIL